MLIRIIQKIKYFSNRILFKLIELELFFSFRSKSNQKRLLLIRIDAIGDFILFSPMLKYYRKLYADYYIALVVNKINKELAQRFNQVDEIVNFDRKKFNNNLLSRRRLLLKIKKNNFDVVVNPIYSRESIGDYLVKISRAKERIGFEGDLTNISFKQKQKNNKYYTKLIKVERKVVSEIERNKKFIETLEIKADDHVPVFSPSVDDEKEAIKILSGKGMQNNAKSAVICLGAGFTDRRWPLTKYATIIKWLRKKSIQVVICGSKNERHLVEALQKQISFPIISIAGQTDLLALAVILKKAILYVGADTGPGHLAAAVGTPTVCVVGGGHPNRFFPYGDLEKNRIVSYQMPCFGCDWNCKYDSVKCVQNITVKQVINEIEKILKNID